MSLPLTLSAYLVRQFFVSTMIALGVVLSVAGLIDMVELIRRTASKEIPFHTVLEMAVMKLPFMTEQILPYAVLIGGMLALTKLTRSQELVVARASGVSAWQFLAPGVLLALVLGGFMLAVFNPLSSAMISRYEQLEARHISGRASLFTVSSSGLWLRQVDTGETVVRGRAVDEYILHALRISQQDFTMSEVTIFTYDKQGAFTGRIDAKTAQLFIGYWQLTDATVSMPGLLPEFHAVYRLPTDLKITEIQDSFAEPQTLSFWELAGFIDTLEKAGFSALRHKVHWHALLSGPLLLAGMVLLAAVFSLRLPRTGKVSLMIMGGLVAGFSMNFLMSLFHAFGYSGGLPVLLAAWAPPTMIIMAGLALLLHLEDG